MGEPVVGSATRSVRRARATLFAALCVAVPSCSSLFEAQDATLLIEVYTRETTMPWPRDGHSEVTLVNSLDDPRGFAGLELEIVGAGGPRVTFMAADFTDADNERTFRVPDSGEMTVSARLTQEDRVVAEGTGSWTLEPKVEWELTVSRAPVPPSERYWYTMDDIGKANPPCYWFWCFRIWRFPVTDSAANYEHEALWLTLYRVHPDECADVCP